MAPWGGNRAAAQKCGAAAAKQSAHDGIHCCRICLVRGQAQPGTFCCTSVQLQDSCGKTRRTRRSSSRYACSWARSWARLLGPSPAHASSTHAAGPVSYTRVSNSRCRACLQHTLTRSRARLRHTLPGPSLTHATVRRHPRLPPTTPHWRWLRSCTAFCQPQKRLPTLAAWEHSSPARSSGARSVE